MGRIVLAAVVLAVGALAQAPTGGLTGTVVDQLGTRIIGAEIVVMGVSWRTEATDLRGEFHIAGLEPGEYHLTVMRAGFAPEQVFGRVAANRTTAIDEIQLKVGTSRNVGCQQWEQLRPTVVVRKRKRNHGILIAGTVRAWDKSSLASAIVRVRSTAEPDSPVVVTTDQNGGFEISGLRPSTYVLTVESRDYDPVMILQITLHDGFEARIDEIQLGSRFTICN